MRGEIRTFRSVCALAVGLASCLTASAADLGRIYIKSFPSRADVYLDGEVESQGKTPCYIKGVTTGTHRIRVHLKGYSDATELVEVAGGETAKTTLTFDGYTRGKNKSSVDSSGTRSAEGRDLLTSKASTSVPRTIDVNCPACSGRGTLSSVRCDTCKGSGLGNHGGCEKCGGSGKTAYRCNGCDGRGSVSSGGREIVCRMCHGKSGPTCRMCSGSGKLKRANPDRATYEVATCFSCKGSGFDVATKCLMCSGRGKYIIGKKKLADCWFCGTTGRAAPLCQRCRGSGMSGPNNNRQPCAPCFATGKMWVPCSDCRGRGWVKAK